jgi:septal ring factor EnvC (AmiA/AmiB activator)
MKTAKGVLIERYEQYKTDLEQAKLDIEKQEKKLEESQESRIRVEKLIKEFKEALDKLDLKKQE